MDAIKQLQFKVMYELRSSYQEKFSGNVKFAPFAVGLYGVNINVYMIRMLLLCLQV